MRALSEGTELLTEDELDEVLYQKNKVPLHNTLKALGINDSEEAARILIQKIRAIDPTRRKDYFIWLLRQVREKHVKIAILDGDNQEDEEQLYQNLSIFEDGKKIPNLHIRIPQQFIDKVPSLPPAPKDKFIPSARLLAQANLAEVPPDCPEFIPVLASVPKTWKELLPRQVDPITGYEISIQKYKIMLLRWKNDREEWVQEYGIGENVKKFEPDIGRYATFGDLSLICDILQTQELQTSNAKHRADKEEVKAGGVRDFDVTENYTITQLFTADAAVFYSKMTHWCTKNVISAQQYMNDHGGSLLLIYRNEPGKKVKTAMVTADLKHTKDITNSDYPIDNELAKSLSKVATLLVKNASTPVEIFGLINAGLLDKFQVADDVRDKMVTQAIAELPKLRSDDLFPIGKAFSCSAEQANTIYNIVKQKQNPECNIDDQGYTGGNTPILFGSKKALGIAIGIKIASDEDPDSIYAYAIDLIETQMGRYKNQATLDKLDVIIANRHAPIQIMTKLAALYDEIFDKGGHFRVPETVQSCVSIASHPCFSDDQKTANLIRIWDKYGKKHGNEFIHSFSSGSALSFLPTDMKYKFMSACSEATTVSLWNHLSNKKRAFHEMFYGDNFTRRNSILLANTQYIAGLSIEDLRELKANGKAKGVKEFDGVTNILTRLETYKSMREATPDDRARILARITDPKVKEKLKHLFNK